MDAKKRTRRQLRAIQAMIGNTTRMFVTNIAASSLALFRTENLGASINSFASPVTSL
uniref:Uncharacterized protein n=1 Tax=Arundo donax TaxID=35708 RepID=A0A0A8ZEG1_ARUDO